MPPTLTEIAAPVEAIDGEISSARCAAASSVSSGLSPELAMHRRPRPLSGRLITPVLALAVVLNSWALTTVGWGNGYYSAAVRSMSKSWQAFLFAGFDRAGFVTVDKPPFSLWVQALSVRVFGFSKPSILIPQVIGGALAVWFLYLTVTRVWGRGAGLVGATALAVTPISVMVNHSNNTDSTLVLLMTIAAYMGVRAAGEGSWKWLVGACAVAGTAMTAKMLAAIPVMPGILVAYAWCAPLDWKRRVREVSVGLLTLAAAGLWWFTMVDFWPKDSRPYVGSSVSNSAYQLAFERNGVNQVEGASTFPGGGPGRRPGGGAPFGRDGVFPGGGLAGDGFRPDGLPGGAAQSSGSGLGALMPGTPGVNSAPNGPATTFGPPNFRDGRGFGGAGGRGGGGPGGVGFGGGQPGARRLFNTDLGGQASWLLIPAGLAGIALLLATRLRPSPRLAAGFVLGGWMAAAGIIFSITKGIVHPYYLASLGPPVAGLVGAGAALALRAVRRRSWWRVALFVAGLVPSVLIEANQLRRSGVTQRWATPIVVVVLSGAVLGLLAVFVKRIGTRLPVAIAALGLVLAPFAWTRASLAAGLNAGLPYANPDGASRRAGGPGSIGSVDSALVAYLKANRHGERFLVATSSAMSAEALVIETGQAVMALGGFSGRDPILTNDKLRTKITKGEVRFFTFGAGGGPGGFGGGGSTVVTSECQTVDQFTGLYDCQNLRSPTAPTSP